MPKDLLDFGEYELGNYKVQYVEWLDGEWRGTGCWLRALVTNRRLLVFPEGAKRASKVEVVAPGDILGVWNLCLGRRDGIMVKLNNRCLLYMLVDWSQGHKLAKDILEMMTPPMKPRIAPRLSPASS